MRRGSHRAAALLIATTVVLPAVASAQELETVLSLASGTGLSLGTGDGDVVRKRSPIFLELEAGLVFDGDHSVEWTPGVILELDGRVSVGINPSVKLVKKLTKPGRISLYGAAGLPFFFAPFTLLGAELGFGGVYQLSSWLGIALELRTHVFFVGNDLPASGILAKLDVALGVRVSL